MCAFIWRGATCSKYARPAPGLQNTQTVGAGAPPRRKKIDPQDYCRFLFVRIVEMKVLDKGKKVLCRGKELVEYQCAK